MISTLKNWTLFYYIHPVEMVPNKRIGTNIIDINGSNDLPVTENIVIDIQKLIQILSSIVSTYSIRVSYNITIYAYVFIKNICEETMVNK